MDASRELRFDGWRLRRDSGELIRGDVRVRLQSQPLAVLEALLARPGEVVTRDDLKSSLWPTGVVDFDTALNSAVRRLRRALDDDADAPRYIETLPRKGYRFIGALEHGDDPSAAHQATVPAVAGAAVPARRRPWLALAAATALAGAVVLVAARFHAADAPVPVLTAAPAPESTRTLDAETLDRLSRARLFLQRRMPGDVERARELLDEIVVRRPRFAEAHAALASAHWHLVLQGVEPRDAGLERMRSAAERAVSLDPASAEGHLRLANYGYATGDERYRVHATIAGTIAPDSALTLGVRAAELQRAGRYEEGLELAQRAALAEPLGATYRYNLAAALFMVGRYADAERVNGEARELNPALSAEITARVMIHGQRIDEALSIAATWPDGPARRQIVALGLAAAKRTADADAAIEALVEVAHDRDPLRIAEAYAFRGENDLAFRWLEIGSRAVEPAPARLDVSVRPWMLKYSPFVAPIRADARWQAWAATAS
jgi:DNA-binding winged helix-turn-helix (wHTH) protein